ncbi:MAG: hypothetical protein QXY96_07090, partial [Candidatus Methanomethylicaceae archaeon]
VVNRSRLHTNDSRGRVRDIFIKGGKEGRETLFRLRERTLKDNLPLRIFNTRGERLFRDINANKEGERHERNTSLKRERKAGGKSSLPIHHSYAGLIAQPTYRGLGKQETDSLSGLISPGENSSSCFPFQYINFSFSLIKVYQNYL